MQRKYMHRQPFWSNIRSYRRWGHLHVTDWFQSVHIAIWNALAPGLSLMHSPNGLNSFTCQNLAPRPWRRFTAQKACSASGSWLVAVMPRHALEVRQDRFSKVGAQNQRNIWRSSAMCRVRADLFLICFFAVIIWDIQVSAKSHGRCATWFA